MAQRAIVVLPDPTGPDTVTIASSVASAFLRLAVAFATRGATNTPFPAASAAKGRFFSPKCFSYVVIIGSLGPNNPEFRELSHKKRFFMSLRVALNKSLLSNSKTFKMDGCEPVFGEMSYEAQI
jgi:hypothetical protein